MNIHSGARITPNIRKEIRASKGVMSQKEVAAHYNVTIPTIRKWQNRDTVILPFLIGSKSRRLSSH